MPQLTSSRSRARSGVCCPARTPEGRPFSVPCMRSVASRSEGRFVFHHPDYQPDLPLATLRAMRALAPASPDDLSSTCAGQPFPHKVSSSFPRTSFAEPAVRTIANYLAQSQPEANSSRYLGLHCLGGVAARNEWSCFSFRTSPSCSQQQAWCADKDDRPLGQRCLTRVRGFREALDAHTEGVHQLPRQDLVADPDTPAGRKALPLHYYSTNLTRLIGIKRPYDPGNFLDFEMGIPTPLESSASSSERGRLRRWGRPWAKRERFDYVLAPRLLDGDVLLAGGGALSRASKNL